jgi:hypothetical protein
MKVGFHIKVNIISILERHLEHPKICAWHIFLASRFRILIVRCLCCYAGCQSGKQSLPVTTFNMNLARDIFVYEQRNQVCQYRLCKKNSVISISKKMLKMLKEFVTLKLMIFTQSDGPTIHI